MKRETLQSVLPFVKEYAASRGKHHDQRFSDGKYWGNAIWGVVHGSDTLNITRGSYSSSYCYDNLNNKYVYDPKAILIQIQPCPDDLDQEAYRHYIQWVLNYSPWRHIFVTKSINHVLKTGVVVVDPDSPKNTMIDGCIALRQAWCNYDNHPRYRQIGLWWKLVQKVNPLTAAAIFYNLLYIGGDNQVREGIVYGGHSPLGQGYEYPTTLDNFVRGKLVDTSKPWSISKAGKAWDIWEHSGPNSKLPTLVKTAITNIGKGKSKVNVFKSIDQSGVYDQSAIIDCLINEIPNMEKEIGV